MHVDGGGDCEHANKQETMVPEDSPNDGSGDIVNLEAEHRVWPKPEGKEGLAQQRVGVSHFFPRFEARISTASALIAILERLWSESRASEVDLAFHDEVQIH